MKKSTRFISIKITTCVIKVTYLKFLLIDEQNAEHIKNLEFSMS